LKAFERGQARASDSLRNSQKCRAFILSDFSWLHRERLKELADGKPRAIQRDAQGLREMQSIHRNSSNFVSLYLCIPVWNAVILGISRDGGRIAYEIYCRLMKKDENPVMWKQVWKAISAEGEYYKYT
jgi:hypothetical protein